MQDRPNCEQCHLNWTSWLTIGSANADERATLDSRESAEGAREMVRKETCPNCKGNRYIVVTAPTGKDSHVRCPHCGGTGYKVRVVR
jgi:DnaJ-class molecular chaperone